ncbi:aminoacyl-tRNA hydrolase [Alteribacillus sp. HJP-4]|uniref:aminoacyl-tRNA hydrolase n=1 Tax=Alteribacillus sp. HJP-4 TaxID=2775394 RepID=UPI0035CCEC07
MKVVAGLGNPGIKYAGTRHNVGFEAVNLLAEQLGVQWKEGKHKSLIAEANAAGEKIFLVKPLTFMNLSGEAIRPLLDYYKCTPEDLLVIYDDLDLDPGVLRLRLKGGHGGHNGIKSLIAHLNTKDFKRMRIGVGKPEPGISVTAHVLGTFAPEEKAEVKNAAERAAKAAEAWFTLPFHDVMNEYNKKMPE